MEERIIKDINNLLAQLFQKMKEAGYEWDSKKKELKIIDWSKHIKYEPNNPSIIEENTTWSDEDELIINKILCICNDFEKSFEISPASTKVIKEDVNKIDNWLKSLKERVQPQYLTITNEELVQAKKEAYNDALNKIEYHSDTPTFNDGWSAAIWYLKKRTTQPQSTWKPSEEQMSSLRDVIYSLPHQPVLFTLYNDLKKLKGE